MDVRLVAAKREEEETLKNLVQLYAYDFSEVVPLDVEETGRFKDAPLDAYWTVPGRFPFLLRVDAHLAGFALVQHRSMLSDAQDVWDMAEFFVLRRYRRHGVGMSAAHTAFAIHTGKWEVRERAANLPAIAFWRKAIGAFAAFTEELVDDDRWRGPVQRFVSPAG